MSVTMHPDLLRLSSFAFFPISSSAHPIRLAEAGFSYCGNEDEVKCADCGLQYRNWNQGDSPSEIHLQRSPTCPFLKSRANNLPLKSTSSKDTTGIHQESIKISDCENDPCKNDDFQNQEFISEPNFIESNFKGFHESNDELDFKGFHESKDASTSKEIFQNLGITFEKAKYPQYAVLPVRMSSYRKWPNYLPQSPRQMAQAGFFYTEQEDLVRCFHCGGGLTNWEPTDDPFVEHAHWFPNCAFLRQSKGDQFIEHIQRLVKDQQENDASSIMEKYLNETDTEIINQSQAGDCMTSPAIQSVLDMGYSMEKIEAAIEVLKLKTESKVYSSMEIMGVLLDFEETEQNMTSSQNEVENNTTISDETKETIASSISTNSMRTSSAGKSEIISLKEENKHLREQTLCKICMDESVDIVFLPCGHIAACHQCAPALKHCPICRTFVKGTVRAFLV